jgi:hypothetical protein
MFSTPSHGESPGLRRVREGTFFDFFSGSVRAPNRSQEPLPGSSEPAPWGGGNRGPSLASGRVPGVTFFDPDRGRFLALGGGSGPSLLMYTCELD